jgi:hypothetical protein
MPSAVILEVDRPERILPRKRQLDSRLSTRKKRLPIDGSGATIISMSSNIEQVLLGVARSLPRDKCQELVDFANFLAQQAASSAPERQGGIFDFIATLPPGTRSKEEIDQQLKEERAAWGDP